MPIVYLDEGGYMLSHYGYADKRQRCYGIHDCQAKGRTNVIGALLNQKLFSVNLFETAIDIDVFDAWLTQDLIPKLPQQKSIIVMDNATFYKREDRLNVINSAGH